MSRGLTLEGLTTTLFLRRSDNPFVDTQMQMQRWFGYRGEYVDLCRVFLSGPQLDLFRAYQDADEALRRTVLAKMNESVENAPAPFVLQGPDFSATGKLTNVSSVPLCPGVTPFIRLVNSADRPDPNVELIFRTFASKPSQDIIVRDVIRGRILEAPCSLTDAAVLLDELHLRGPPTHGRRLGRPTLEGPGGESRDRIRERRRRATSLLPAPWHHLCGGGHSLRSEWAVRYKRLSSLMEGVPQTSCTRTSSN